MSKTFQLLTALLLIAGLSFVSPVSCIAAEDTPDESGEPCVTDPTQEPIVDPSSPPVSVGQVDENGEPCVSDPDKKPTTVTQPSPFGGPSKRPDVIDIEKQPWFVESANLPANSPVLKREKMLWAKSFIWAEAPEIEVERWVTEKPDMEGKYLLVEVWATWCPPCRRSLKLLEYYHEKYGDELCVISICETDEEALKAMKGPTELDDIKCHLAVDTKRRFADALGVFGIPHCVLIEPQYGAVIWEGMPTLPGHELNEDIIRRVLEIGRKMKAAEEKAAE